MVSYDNDSIQSNETVSDYETLGFDHNGTIQFEQLNGVPFFGFTYFPIRKDKDLHRLYKARPLTNDYCKKHTHGNNCLDYLDGYFIFQWK